VSLEDSFGHGFTKGCDTPKDVMVHDGDLWRSYKRTRVHNQGRKFLARQGEKESSVILRKDEEGELPQGAKSLHLGGLVLP
jgi:hypothetical protein